MLDALIAARANTAADKCSGGMAVGIDAVLFEGEQIVHLDGFTFHAHDLADAGDFSATTGDAANLHDNLNGGGDLGREGNAARNFEAQYSAFQAGEEFLYGYGTDFEGACRGLPDFRVR